MQFTKLDDSPMFRQQMQCMEESGEALRGRCLKFYKGCRKYTEGLGEGYEGDVAFASALETFGGGHSDPICVAFGGPVMNKLTIALREIVTYKEVLRSQVEHLLNDKLQHFVSFELQDIKAYASYMNGLLLFEQDRNWDTALKNFISARAVYEELEKYGDLENQVLCRERVEELEPSIRYCRNKIGESNLKTSELLQIGEMEGPALDLFKAKLEAAMAEARSQQAASLTEFHWLGHRLPMSNAKTRGALLKAQELEKDLHGPAADSLPAEKKLAGAPFAVTCAGNADSVKDGLNGLDKAVSAVLGQRTIEHNQLLVSIAKIKLPRRHDDRNEKLTEPEVLVRLYDLLLQNTADLSDLVSSGRDRKSEEVAFAEDCVLRSMAFRAQWLESEMCFYLAKSYSSAGKRMEASALYCHARSLAEDALKKFQIAMDTDEVMTEELKTLYDECRANSCTEHATGITEDEKDPENLSKKISTISVSGVDKKKFLKKLDVYKSAVGEPNVKSVLRIEVFPPAFQSISRNPIVLDLAYNCIDFPSLENRMKKDKKGFKSRLWQ